MENNATITKDSITAVEANEIKDELAAVGVEISVDYTDSHLIPSDNGYCTFVQFEIKDVTDEKIAQFENALAKRGVKLHVAKLEDMNDEEREDEVQNRGVFRAVKEVYEDEGVICVSVPIDGFIDIDFVKEIDCDTPGEVLDELVEKRLQFKEYGLPVVKLVSGSYRIAKDEEAANAAAREYIENSLWAFRADFLSRQTGVDSSVFEALQPMCEGAQEGIESIIEATCGMDEFVEAAIQSDGRGHLLSSYDGEEIEAGEYRVYQRD